MSSSALESTQPKAASPATRTLNAAVLDMLPFHDTQDFADARRGFIATLPDVEIKNDRGRVVWSLHEYAFLAQEQSPDTVNPSLWRQARLNMNNGLYKIIDRIYQVRGFDLSNMTIIEGAEGLIIIDPLISCETARAALNLYIEHRGQRPVKAVIYSHSHVDHYGGVKGIIDESDVRSGKVAVIAPDRFLEEVTQETVLVGGPMVRRAQFQFGATLFKGERGQVDAGLGKVTSSGRVSLIAPTHTICQPIESHVIDGVEILFQLTPDTEAKAEMHMFYPGLGALTPRRTATKRSSRIPTRSASTAIRIATSASGSANTSASVRTWHASRCRSPTNICCRASRRSSSPVRSTGCTRAWSVALRHGVRAQHPTRGDSSWRRGCAATRRRRTIEANHLHIDTGYIERDLERRAPPRSPCESSSPLARWARWRRPTTRSWAFRATTRAAGRERERPAIAAAMKSEEVDLALLAPSDPTAAGPWDWYRGSSRPPASRPSRST